MFSVSLAGQNKSIKYLAVQKMKRRYYFSYQKNNASLEQLNSYIKEDYIPLPLVSVLELIGLELTIKLLKAYQGKRFYVPVKNHNSSKLNEILPVDAVLKLSEAMGGTRIDLRTTSIKGVYNAAYFELLKKQYSDSKMSIDEFCSAYNLTISDRKKRSFVLPLK